MSQSVDYPQVNVSIGVQNAADFLVAVGATKSKSDAKRLIEQGAVDWVRMNELGEKVDEVKIKDFRTMISIERPGPQGILRAGKVFLKIGCNNS
jgi:tyrosyl-tRNA synthetase